MKNKEKEEKKMRKRGCCHKYNAVTGAEKKGGGERLETTRNTGRNVCEFERERDIITIARTWLQ